MSQKNKLELLLTLGVDAFKRGLNEAEAGVRNFSSNVSKAFSMVAGIVAPVTSLVSAAAGLNKIVGVTREFDKLEAGLITATGSAEGSKEAFGAIQDFASTTPYDLAQVTDSFVKLVNFGLNPSQRAMTSYGNTSSALGKDLNQMIEAVADAATGEFERLKEFGIKSKSEGDKVSFTFRGITTTVGKNAKEIEDYLIKLGEANFGDAMANRMSTLDGALSNLGDEWDKLFLNISQQGIGDAIADGVRVGIDALGELNAMIVSGQLEGYLKAYAGQWSSWSADVKNSIGLVGQYFDGEMALMQKRGIDVSFSLSDAFAQMPTNMRAAIQIVTVEAASFWDKLVLHAKSAGKEFLAGIMGREDELARLQAERSGSKEMKIIDAAREATIDAILNERQAAIDSMNAQIEAAKKLRAEWEKNNKARLAGTTDRTEKFQVKDGKSTEQQKSKDFSPKTGAKFIQKDGQWVEDTTAQIAKKKAVESEKVQIEEDAAKKSVTIAKTTAKAKQEIAKKAEIQEPVFYSRFAKERLGIDRKHEQDKTKEEPPADLDQESKEDERQKKREARQERLRQSAEKTRQQTEEIGAAAEQTEQAIAQANAERLEAAKKGADEWAQAETQATEKAKSAFQRYADKVKSLQADISGREKSLAEELDGLDTKTSAESKWRRKANEAKDYEKAAKAAMAAGDTEKALSLSDQAKSAYSSLKGGAGSISGKLGDQTALQGVRSSGLLGIDIAKILQQVTAKTALTTMPAGDLFGDLSGRIRGQLAAVAGGGAGPAQGKAEVPVAKVHELKFAGGSMRGGEADVEALLNLLAKAGMNAA